MSETRRLRINQGKLIPLWLRMLIVASLFACLISVNQHLGKDLAILLSIVFSTPILPLWYSYQLLEVDQDAKAYQRGYWIAGYKIGKWKSYEKINDISIVESKNRGLLNFSNQRKSYEAYLVFDDSGRIYLIGSNSGGELKVRLKDICEKLNLKESIK